MLVITKLTYAEVEFRLSGFGTVGLTHSSSKQVDFTTQLYTSGAGYSHDTDIGNDSLAAIQLDTKINQYLSSSVQIMSQRHSTKNNFDPHVELANIKFTPVSNLAIRVGRLGLPAFIASDYINVNYGNLWARAPVEVYNQVPFTHVDGTDVIYQKDMAGGTLSLQGIYFNLVLDDYRGYKVKAKDGKMFNISYEKGPFLTRVLWGKIHNIFEPLQPIPGADTPIIKTLMNEIAGPTKAKYMAAGFVYDPGHWILQGEYTHRVADSVAIATTNSWYLMAGKRIQKFTPYLTVSSLKSKGPYNSPYATFLESGVYGPDLVKLGQAVNAGIAYQNQSQTSFATGIRYDIAQNIAIKAQYDYIKPSAGSYGMFSYPANQTSPANAVHLLTVNLSFVF